MNKKRVFHSRNYCFKIFFLVILTTLLISCGSGGGGGGGDGTDNDGANNGLVYTGAQNQATLTDANAEEITIAAFMGGSTGSSIGTLSNSLTSQYALADHPRLLNLAQVLRDALVQDNAAASSSNIEITAISSGYIVVEGDCAVNPGELLLDIDYDDVSGNFTGTASFNNFCSQGVTVSGVGDLSGNGLLSGNKFYTYQMSISFYPLNMISENDSYTANGIIQYDFTGLQIKVDMDMLLKDNSTSKVSKIDDCTMYLTQGSGYEDIDIIDGRFYHPDFGFVNISTIIPLRFGAGKIWPSTGEFIITGNAGTKARLTVLSETRYQIDADTDGNDSYEWGTGILHWPGTSNNIPVADAGPEQNVYTDSVITLDGSASSDDDGDPLTYTWSFVSVPPGSVAVLSDPDSVDPSFTSDMEGTYVVSLVVNDNTDNSAPDSVSITAFSDDMNHLAYRVIDAEYSNQLDRIIMVSATPSNHLHILDPLTEQHTSVNLSYTPTSVSVSPDGLFAAVGHDSWISYIALGTASLIKVIPVSTDAVDVVLAGNGYVYVFPREDQWERIRSVNLATETETLHTGNFVYDGTLAKLHPDGTSIYGTNNGLSPSDIEKYDVSGGTADYLYDSPYHGDFPVCGDLWISEDGQRIFTRCGNVFSASDVQSEDMKYKGSLSELENVSHLGHSSASGKVAAIPKNSYFVNDNDTEVQIYNDEFLAHEESIRFPDFFIQTNSYAGHGRFVFFNSDGSRYFVILQADETSGILYDYGVMTYSVKESPALPDPDNGSGMNYDIVDAEYSKTLDKIVIISSSPSYQLHMYDPEADQTTSVVLNLLPTSVSVSPDGLYAAVAHDGWVSYVDLSTAVLLKVMQVSTVISDVVLAGNGYIYAFPEVDQHVKIRCINISTEEETLQTGNYVRERTVAKLHPNGTAIYGADNGVSPSDIEKYDISGGTAVYLYDSPYHGDYGMCGNLWMSEDGLRIFTRCGNVFRASNVESEDMTYNGELGDLNFIKELSHSSFSGKVVAIPENPSGIDDNDTEVQVYTYALLTLEESISLPAVTVGTDLYQGHGEFVFFNSDGIRYHVVYKANDSYAVVTHSVN